VKSAQPRTFRNPSADRPSVRTSSCSSQSRPLNLQEGCSVHRGRCRNLISGAVLTCAVLCVFAGVSVADDPGHEPKPNKPQATAEANAAETVGVPVEIDGRPILPVYSATGGVSPEERAPGIEERILGFARRRNVPADLIHAEDRGAWTEIVAGNDIIMGVTESEARAAGRSRAQISAEYAEIIRRTVIRYRQEHTWGGLLRGVLFSFIATTALILVFLLLFRGRRAARNRLEEWIRRTEENFSPESFRARIARYFVVPLIGTGMIAGTATVVALLEVYATLTLGFFPSTRYTALKINRWTISELAGLGKVVWTYLPNLVVVVLIAVAARYLVRLNKYLFKEIQEGTLRIHGFYPDWAEPTAKLVRLLILAATAVVAFPYLPGSNSPAFRGISVFLGVLLSLGSTSAVAHGVAGTILTYMRSFNVGDFVKVGDTVGQVVEKTLLVTRICTQKKEIVTIPNGSVLGGVVVNYSAEARKDGVIFYTRVSIGYNAPWRRVHELLIASALSTKEILSFPGPFVLQSNLDDFYVSYELNAFTNRPENMQNIYSDLHKNIQDKFNEGGIEINSPHYTSLRDGNRLAIPDEYAPKDYKEPAFSVREFRASDTSSGEPTSMKVPASHS
jgi:small-conductance mechanosensitive channel